MQRLKDRPQFQAVLAGRTVVKTAHFALHRSPLGPPPVGEGALARPSLFAAQVVWMGAMVPKKWAKRAVTRNTIKRQIYTVAACYEQGLHIAAHVVRLRSGFDVKQFSSATSHALRQAVRLELQHLFDAACAPAPAAGAQTP